MQLTNLTRISTALSIVLVLATPTSLKAQTSPMLGNWLEPGGAVIQIEACSSGICLRLISLAPDNPANVDNQNPDPAKRSRPLCNLEIGSSFHLDDATHASGGTLYDPKSGRTYHGTITLDGNVLRLRGYIGVPLFGRTETWRRAQIGQGRGC
jgi:uncharacterized protein (DUF2147 family)